VEGRRPRSRRARLKAEAVLANEKTVEVSAPFECLWGVLLRVICQYADAHKKAAKHELGPWE